MTPAASDRLRRHWPIPALGLVTLWLFRDVLSGQRIFYERDLHLQWFGQARTIARALRAGAWPFWDDAVGFGQPVWANPNNQVLYPPTLLLTWLEPWTYLTVFVLLHAAIAGGGMLALARRLALSPAAAFVAASVWIAGGPFLSLVPLWNHLAAAAWLPWIVLAADRLTERPTPRRAAALAAALAAPILCGSPDLTAQGWLLALVPPVVRARRGEGPWRRRAALAFTGAALLALGLTAAQWLPTLGHLQATARASVPTSERTLWSLHPATLFQLVLPVPLADLPLRPELREALSSGREPYLRSIHLGLLSGLLAVAGLTAPRRREATALALTAAGLLLLALGVHTPVHGWLSALWPPLRALRFPIKFVVGPAFVWALLAGIGLDTIRARSLPWLTRLVAAGAVAAGGALLLLAAPETIGTGLLVRLPHGPAFSHTLRPSLVALGGTALFASLALVVLHRARDLRSWSLLLALLAIVEPVGQNATLNPTAPRQTLEAPPPLLEALRRDGARRLYVFDYDVEDAIRFLQRPVPYRIVVSDLRSGEKWIEAAALRAYLLPPLAAAWGLRGSYEYDRLLLQPSPVVAVEGMLWALQATPAHTRLLQLAGVTHVVALHDQGFEDLTPVTRLAGPFAEDIRIFRVPGPLPEVLAVPTVRPLTRLTDLLAPEFDPTSQALMARLPFPGPGPGPAEEDGASTDPRQASMPAGLTARILERQPDQIRIEVDASTPGQVVLLDAVAPGWGATVDGRPVPLLAANGPFRSAPVPEGTHVVVFGYRPPHLTAGLIASLTALGALLLGLARRERNGTLPSPAPGT